MKEKIEINSEAITLRKYFGEDGYSPIDVFSMLNNNEDITVVFYPMSERISGMSIRDRKIKLIVINSTLTYGRQRFTAAHEICHLFLHETSKASSAVKILIKIKTLKRKRRICSPHIFWRLTNL